MATTESVLVTQATVGLIFSGFLQYLKSRASISFVNQHSAAINHAIMVITAGFGSLGIHAAWSGSAHSFTVTGLDLAAIAAGAWLWAKQWAVQFLVHHNVFGPVASFSAPPTALDPQGVHR